jgi:integrase/recombinase XerD
MSRRLWLPVVSGPLAPYAAGYRVWMLERGYKPRSVVNRLELLGQLSRWLEVEALTPVELTPEQVERFLEPRRAAGYSRCVSAQSRSLPLEYLRELGVAPCPAPVEVAEGPLERLLLDYRRYLFEERGLCARTVLECYEPTARSFLSGREGPHGLAIGDLSAADVSGFLARELPERGIDTARTVASGLRCLLRYLRMVGLIELPLEWAVPGIADLRDRSLPKGLEPAVVAKLLACCDRRRTVGRRDYAVLLLLWRLGLRRGEVAGLGLDDIDWRGGEILVRGKGGRQDVLPLPVDVGEAIVSYLRRRPRIEDRTLFCGCMHRQGRFTQAECCRSFAPLASARACREWGPISSGTRRRRGCCGAARRLRRSGRCFATATSARPRVTRRSTARRYGGSRGRGRKAVRHDTVAASA